MQYPYTQYTRHTINAQIFYPALLNVWVYEVQDRSRRLRKSRPQQDESTVSSSQASDNGSEPTSRKHTRETRRQELEEALPIAQRMDELMVSPPYDSSVELLRLRGMVGLWIADLHASTATSAEVEDSSEYSLNYGLDTAEAQQSRDRSEVERRKALVWLRKAKAGGCQLPANVDLPLVDDGSG